MKISGHALKRSKQRGIPKDYIDIILQYGTHVRKPGHALEIKIQKRDKTQIIKNLKRLVNTIDKCAKKAVLVDSDTGDIITVYNTY